ncbi:MAG: hypothetical protein GOV02_01195 [Candidatus Aenigmarchaeota archaeon]|nr:hypothetical protein [Candidatus Aenigmarchaeota archaeon]
MTERYFQAQRFATQMGGEIPQLNTVLVDPWRGLNAVYGMSICNNDCDSCSLGRYVQDSDISIKVNDVSFALIPATEDEKKEYGYQNNLSCKTVDEVRNAFVLYLTKKLGTYKEFLGELKDIRGTDVIYSRGSVISNGSVLSNEEVTEEFRKSIITVALGKLSSTESRLHIFEKAVDKVFPDYLLSD